MQLPRLVRDAEKVPLDRVGGVGAEPVAEREVEFLDGPHEGDVAFADEFLERIVRVDELLGDRDDEPEVRRDDDRLHRLGLGEPGLHLVDLLDRRPAAVEPAPGGGGAKLQPVHPPEIKLLFVLGEQPRLIEAGQVGRERLGGGGRLVLLQRNRRIGRGDGGKLFSVCLQKLPAGDVFDLPAEELLATLVEEGLPLGEGLGRDRPLGLGLSAFPIHASRKLLDGRNHARPS